MRDLRTQRLYPVFHCNSFITLDFLYLCNLLDLIFGVWSVLWIEVLFCFSNRCSTFSHYICWKDDWYFIQLLLQFCWKSVGRVCEGLFLDYFVPLMYVSVFSMISHFLYYLIIYNKSWNHIERTPQLCSSSQLFFCASSFVFI